MKRALITGGAFGTVLVLGALAAGHRFLERVVDPAMATPPAIVVPGREERGAERARVILRSGEQLLLERAGDLGLGNAGLLIFDDGDRPPRARALG